MRPTRRNPNRHKRDLSKTPSGRFGFLIFSLSSVVAILLGLSLRSYLSPDRLRIWIDRAIAEQPNAIGVHYTDIGIRLASGSFPQIALELSNVEITPRSDCQAQPSIRASRLRFPLRIASLLTGTFAFGFIYANDLEIDVDQLRTRCAATNGPLSSAEASISAHEPRQPTKPAWWKSEEFFRLREAVSGIEFARARLHFENKTKSIYLEKFRAALDPNDVAFIVNGRVRIPRELTEGEQLPDLEMTAVVREAEVRLRTEARLNEGRLSGEARLFPTADHDLQIESRIQIASLPLSTAVPLVSKVALIKRPMRPKFLWLNCQAEIHGRFRRLFSENPLEIRNCEMSGKGTSIQVAKATHLPNGDWEPFAAVVRSADVRQLLETFSIGGLDGIATDFGRLDGLIHVDKQNVGFEGQLDGMRLHFSNRDRRALQTVRNLQLTVELDSLGGVSGGISQMEVEGGEFAGDLKYEFTKSANTGRVRLDLTKLRLSDDVEALMTGGRTAGASGHLMADFSLGRFANLSGELSFRGFRSADWEIDDLKVSPALVGDDRDVQIKLRAASAKLLAGSALHLATRDLLFTQYVADQPLSLRDMMIEGIVPRAGGFRWTQMSGSAFGGRFKFASQGVWSRDKREMTGDLRTDYPAVKKIYWALGGTPNEPVFSLDESKAPISFLERVKSGSITNRDLGFTSIKQNQ